MSGLCPEIGPARVVPMMLALTLAPWIETQVPNPPGVPTTVEAPKTDESGTSTASTPENPQATVAEPTGPIEVDPNVSDLDIQQTLERILPQYPGVRTISVGVDEGVVDLRGQVENDEVRDRVRDFVRRVEGVRLVLNHLLTDAQVMTASELVARQAGIFWGAVRKYWLLTIAGFVITLMGLGLGRAFSRNSDVILSPFVANPLLRSVLSSIIAGMLGMGGFLLALKALDLTQAVLSVIGFAGIVGLAIGFAFRDIAENFIASILLGLRRPFRLGDYVEVAGQSGLIKALNTRATVLVTVDGKHVRIPNSVMFKEIMVNHSSSPTIRHTFDVVVPYQSSTDSALDALTRSLLGQEELCDEPKPRALVEELTAQGVRIRSYFWIPSQGVDGLQLQGGAMLRAKVALQQAGIPFTAGLSVSVSVAGQVPVLVSRLESSVQVVHPAATAPIITAVQAQANMRRDVQAAQAAARPSEIDESELPRQQILETPESTVSDEGASLLKE